MVYLFVSLENEIKFGLKTKTFYRNIFLGNGKFMVSANAIEQMDISVQCGVMLLLRGF